MLENNFANCFSILIVDDNPKSLELLEVLLESEGHVVHKAENGVEALKILEEKTDDFFDIIITDVMMPKMNGFELCRRVKGNEKTYSTPFVPWIPGKLYL